jgi:hypothetical protein
MAIIIQGTMIGIARSGCLDPFFEATTGYTEVTLKTAQAFSLANPTCPAFSSNS